MTQGLGREYISLMTNSVIIDGRSNCVTFGVEARAVVRLVKYCPVRSLSAHDGPCLSYLEYDVKEGSDFDFTHSTDIAHRLEE